MVNRERVWIDGVPVDNIDMQMAISRIKDMLAKKETGNYILAVNPEKIILIHQKTYLKSAFEKASLLIPDGVGVVLAMKWLYKTPATRVTGVDLMLNICKEAASNAYKVYIFGATEEVNQKAVDTLYSLSPGIRIVGQCHGYLKENEMEGLISNVNQSQADILFVALGSPKQEEWIQKYLPKINVKICQGIGGTLDVIAGTKKRAPKLFQRLGIEWLYRLICEPRRIHRQTALPLFAIRILKYAFLLSIVRTISKSAESCSAEEL